MGLFDYFRHRRERESAVPESREVSPPSTQVSPLADGGAAEAQKQMADAGMDLGQIAQIGQMIAEAARSGNVQIQHGDPQAIELDAAQTIDLGGSGLREEILGILEQHGVDPDPASPQEIDASTDAGDAAADPRRDRAPGRRPRRLDAGRRRGSRRALACPPPRP